MQANMVPDIRYLFSGVIRPVIRYIRHSRAILL